MEGSRAKNQVLQNAKWTRIEGSQIMQADNINNFYDSSGKINAFQLLYQNAVSGAMHDAKERFDPPKCHPGTRDTILQHIQTWARDAESPKTILWVSGAAGVGKSAIVQTVAEQLHQTQFPLATFFFFRRGGESRNTPEWLIATIVYQAALAVPQIKPFVLRVIERDPNIFSRSMRTQVQELLFNPMLEAGVTDPIFIAVDGLDECVSDQSHTEVLDAFATVFHLSRPPIRLLIASRREPHIVEAFREDNLSSLSYSICLDDAEYQSNADIEVYIRSCFGDIKKTRRSLKVDWPSSDDIEKLVEKASGQFIYASTAMRFIGNRDHNPTRALQVILGLTTSKGKESLPFAELDSLYEHILSRCLDVDLTVDILQTYHHMFSAESYATPEFMDEFLSLEDGDTEYALSRMHSVVYFPDAGQHNSDRSKNIIRVYHKSFGDFLANQTRSGKYYQPTSEIHLSMVRRCYHSSLESKNDPPSEDSETKQSQWHTVLAYAFRYMFEHIEFLEHANIISLLEGLDPIQYCRRFSQSANTALNILGTLDVMMIDEYWDDSRPILPSDRELVFNFFINAWDQCFCEVLDSYPRSEKLLPFFAMAVYADGHYIDSDSFNTFARMMVYTWTPNKNQEPFVKNAHKVKEGVIYDVIKDEAIVVTDRSKLSLATEPHRSRILTDFFQDPQRAGKYFLKNEDIALAVNLLLDYLFTDIHDPPAEFIGRRRQWFTIALGTAVILVERYPEVSTMLEERLNNIKADSGNLWEIVDEGMQAEFKNIVNIE